jgi:hypothetical protein
LKKKKKKRKGSHPLPFGPAAHQSTLAPLAAARVPLSSFLFPWSLTPGPHLLAPFSFLPPFFSLLRPIVRRRNHHHAQPPPFLFPSVRASQLRQLIVAFNPRPFPLPLTPFTPGRSAGHLWQAAGRRVVSSPLSLTLYLKPSSSSRSPLCTYFAPTHAPEHRIHPAPPHCLRRHRWGSSSPVKDFPFSLFLHL